MTNPTPTPSSGSQDEIAHDEARRSLRRLSANHFDDSGITEDQLIEAVRSLGRYINEQEAAAINALPAKGAEAEPPKLAQLEARRDELNRELISLYLKIHVAQEGEWPEHKCRLNGKEIITKGKCFGANLLTHLLPDQAGYAVFMENKGNAPDILIRQGDPVPYGARCYSVPNTFGGIIDDEYDE